MFPIQNIEWRWDMSMRSRPHNAVLLFNNPQMLVAYKAKLALNFVFITLYYMSVAAFAYSTWLLALGPSLKEKQTSGTCHVGYRWYQGNKAAETCYLDWVCTYSIHSHSNDQCKSHNQWMGSVFSFCKRRRL